MLKLVAALLAVPLSFLGAVAGTGVLVVDVREGGPDGHHIVLPVPLMLAQAAAGLAPQPDAGIGSRELREYLPAAQQVLEALAEAPDGEIVRVEEKDGQVLVAKVGRNLRIRVHGRGEDVSVNLPIAMATEVLRHCGGGRVDAAAIVGALHRARMTDLVEVHDGADYVKLSVW